MNMDRNIEIILELFVVIENSIYNKKIIRFFMDKKILERKADC